MDAESEKTQETDADESVPDSNIMKIDTINFEKSILNEKENDKTLTDSSLHIYCEKNSVKNLCSEHSYSMPTVTIKNTDGVDTKAFAESNIVLVTSKVADNQPEMTTLVNTEEICDVGFVSSMIEVVNSVEVDGCDNVSSSSDSDSSDSDSDSSSSSSDTTSSEDSCTLRIRHEDIELEEEIAALKNTDPPKVKGEILHNELPPVDDINISLPEDSILEGIGKVWQIMKDHSVVVKSFDNKPALDFQTILFFAKDLAFGLVDETFGPVTSPYYVIRFNSEEHRISKGVELEREVFFAPHIKDFTSFVFVSELKKIRGSDASWSNDQEPPPSCIDYSDDEQERDARRQRKNKANAQNDTAENNSSSSGASTSTRGRGRGRGRKREHWHNESTRVNVRSSAEDSQIGWQNAVRGRGHQGPSVNNSMPPQAPTLFNCFQTLPPYAAFPGGPFGPPAPPPFNQPSQPPPRGNYNQRPQFMNWPQQGSFRHPPPTMYGFGRPPPPPPP